MRHDDAGRTTIEGIQYVRRISRWHSNKRGQAACTGRCDTGIEFEALKRRMFGIEAQSVQVGFAQHLAYEGRWRFHPRSDQQIMI